MPNSTSTYALTERRSLQKRRVTRCLTRLSIVISVLLLSGCELFQSRPQSTEEPSSGQNHWHAQGKFSYRSEQASQSGNFDWRQAMDDYQIRLYGPLGLGSVKISGGADSIHVQTPRQDLSSDQPEQLLLDTTGIYLPIRSLSKWMKGVPATSFAQNKTYDEKGILTGFTESGWDVAYADHEPMFFYSTSEAIEETVYIPMRIELSQANIEMLLINKSWDFQ